MAVAIVKYTVVFSAQQIVRIGAELALVKAAGPKSALAYAAEQEKTRARADREP